MSNNTKRRHRDLSELASLLEMRNRPDGIAEGLATDAPAVVKSNWRTLPANDNKTPTADGFGTERAVEIIPSVDKIMAEVAGDDVEHGWHVDDDGKRHKVIIRWGKLRFSDGAQTERGERLSMGAVVEAALVMPVGAMLGTREKSARDKGSAPDPVDIASSNAYFGGEKTETRPAGLFSAKFAHRSFAKAPLKARRGPKSKVEARQWLADAAANTAVMPEVTKCEVGFPAGPANLAQLFPGLVKVATGSGGSQAWEGIASEYEERQEWHAALQAMKDNDVELLTRAVSAKSLAELGEARGYSGKYAMAAGRRLLVAANDNFVAAKKLASDGKVS